MPKKKGKYYESLKFVIPYHTRSTLTRDLYLIIEAFFLLLLFFFYQGSDHGH